MPASTTSPSARPTGSSAGLRPGRARRTIPGSANSGSDPRAAALAAIAEVFRAQGYEGASLSAITAATGLGKGSLYHLFPGGKAQMAEEVLAGIEAWFEREVFSGLRDLPADQGLDRMFAAVETYFRGGGRVCLVGVLALGEVRDRFATAIEGYFAAWRDALADALRRAGRPDPAGLAEEILAGIQGALVLARAARDTELFGRLMARLRLAAAEAA